MSPDLDLDGRPELLVGAPGAAGGDGELLIYRGSDDGLLTVPLAISSPSEGGGFGASLASLGDLEGDGSLDIAVGAPEDGGGDGAVYTLTAEAGVFSAAERLAGGSGGQSYGSALSAGGDLDSDGLGELVVGTGHRAGLVEVLEALIDEDEDGYDADSDCDDADPDIHPGATERAGDGVDQDCDGEELCFEDDDEDGYLDRTGDTRSSADLDCADRFEGGLSSPLTDCDDSDAALHPGAAEGPGDGVDSDCDGQELCYADADGDGVVAEGVEVYSADLDCADAGEGAASLPGGDCDDSDPDIRPDALEQTGDGVDSDCDGVELCYADADGDGHRPGPSATVASDDADCADPGEASAEAGSQDCDDADPAVHPGAPEGTGDEVDQDCDGLELCFADRDDDGYLGASGGAVLSEDADCQDAGEGSLSTPTTDCDDRDGASHPGATEQIGDGVDQDCDGAELCYVDADQDGHRSATGATAASADPDCLDAGEAEARQPATDCDDFDDDVNPDAEEQVADLVDSDCDGAELCYADADRDGFRDAEGGTVESDDPDCLDGGEADAQDLTGDCDDSRASVYPGASEVVADGIDQDCDGEDPSSQFDLVGQGKSWVGGGVACSAAGSGQAGALLGLLGLLAGASRRREVRP